MIAGNIGWGKTNTAMAIAVRNMPFGRRIVVPGDPKDDWLRLALALGGQGIRLGRGLPARLNPLDGGVKPAGQDQAVWESEVWNRRQKLLIALVATAAPAIAPLEPLAVAALDLALAAAVAAQGTPTLPHVAYHLGNPDPQRAQDAGYDAELLRDRGQPVYAVLSSLIGGHLGGLFDGPSTVRFDPDGPDDRARLRRPGRGRPAAVAGDAVLRRRGSAPPWPTRVTGNGSSSTTRPGGSSPAKPSWTG